MQFYTSSRTKTAADKCALHRMLRKAAATLSLSAGAQAVLWHLADATEWNDELESWFTSRRAETFTRAAGYEYQAGLRKLAELRAVGLIGRVSDGNQYAHPVLTVAEPDEAWESQLEKWRTELDRFQHATRNGSRAGALPRPARRRAMPSAPARDGERAGAPCDARRRATHSADPICLSKDTGKYTSSSSSQQLPGDDDDAFSREVEEVAAIVAKVRGIDQATIHERAATIIETARKCVDVRQSPMLTSIEFAEFLLWSVQGVGLKNPAGRFTRLATQVPDATMIGRWRRKTAISSATKPAAMVEAKPVPRVEVPIEHRIRLLQQTLANPKTGERMKAVAAQELAELQGGAA